MKSMSQKPESRDGAPNVIAAPGMPEQAPRDPETDCKWCKMRDDNSRCVLCDLKDDEAVNE